MAHGKPRKDEVKGAGKQIPRREFLGQIALAGAGLVLGASVLRAASYTQSDSTLYISTPVLNPPDSFPAIPGAFQHVTKNVKVPFHPNSIWNRPIGQNPKIKSHSKRMMQGLLAQFDDPDHAAITLSGVNQVWSQPVYYADENTPRRRVCYPDHVSFCTNDVPIPDEALPDPTSDGNAVVIDTSVIPNRAWSFWALARSNGVREDWIAGSYGWTDISATGDGLRNHGGGRWGGRATGWNKYAGLITPEEIRQGQIDHALVMSIDGAVVSRQPVWPALGSDGYSFDPNDVPMGARFQLDPEVDVNDLNLTEGGKVIARALQTHGAWLGDTGTATAIYAQEFLTIDVFGEVVLDPSPWEGLLSGDDLADFPMSSLRIVEVNRSDFYEKYGD